MKQGIVKEMVSFFTANIPAPIATDIPNNPLNIQYRISAKDSVVENLFIILTATGNNTTDIPIIANIMVKKIYTPDFSLTHGLDLNKEVIDTPPNTIYFIIREIFFNTYAEIYNKRYIRFNHKIHCYTIKCSV